MNLPEKCSRLQLPPSPEGREGGMEQKLLSSRVASTWKRYSRALLSGCNNRVPVLIAVGGEATIMHFSNCTVTTLNSHDTQDHVHAVISHSLHFFFVCVGLYVALPKGLGLMCSTWPTFTVNRLPQQSLQNRHFTHTYTHKITSHGPGKERHLTQCKFAPPRWYSQGKDQQMSPHKPRKVTCVPKHTPTTHYYTTLSFFLGE